MKLTIDGRGVEVPPGATVLYAVNRLDIELPQLCKDPDRAPLGACGEGSGLGCLGKLSI